MKKASVLVIIVTYNGIQWIDKCLRSLSGSTVPVDIVVIDNGSTDGTIEAIERCYPEVRLIKSATNLYFGRGNNIGLEIALAEGYEYAFLLNQDAWVDEGCISILVEIAKQHREYGIISPLHFDYEGKGLEKYFELISNEKDCPGFLTDYCAQTLKDIYPIDFIHAAAWLLPLPAIKKVGGFDPIFQHYSEDIDYVNRLKFKGLKIGFVPAAKFYHLGTHEGLKNFESNLKFRYHFNILKLKNLNASVQGAILLFVKGSLLNLLSSLRSLALPKFVFELKLFGKTLMKMHKILRTRKLSRNYLAYLK